MHPPLKDLDSFVAVYCTASASDLLCLAVQYSNSVFIDFISSSYLVDVKVEPCRAGCETLPTDEHS